MNYSSIDASQKIIVQINQLLSESQHILSQLVHVDDSEENASYETNIKIMQLLLEYRLSGQDALGRVLNLDHNLIALLGIEPKHHSATNLERLAFALGSEDLKQILYGITQLVDALLKAIHAYQKNKKQQERARFQNKINKPSKLLLGMQRIVMDQKKILMLLNELGEHIEQLTPEDVLGPIYDHIGAIRGPVSQFYQAIQNGIALAHELQTTSKAVPLNLPLSNLLKQADDLLQHTPETSHPQPHYQFIPSSTETLERLEQRAATKRLTPFFNH